MVARIVMAGALAAMLADGVIEVRDETGLKKHQSGIRHPSDVIKPSAQPSLFYPGG
jgi:coenzyme F420-reducing hydrogenase beta subunit